MSQVYEQDFLIVRKVRTAMEGVVPNQSILILAQRLAMMQEPELAAFGKKNVKFQDKMIENLLQDN